MKSMGIHYFKLKAITPLHFGAKEEYSPLGYVVDKNNSAIKLFDENSFIPLLNTKEKNNFLHFFDQDEVDFSKILKFMHKNVTPYINYGKSIKASSKYINQYFNEIEKKYISMDRIIINRTMYDNLTGLPFIPGSSIKGSIKTATLNILAGNKNFYDSNKMSKELLGSFENDPFSIIKISDFHSFNKNITEVTITKTLKKANASTRPNYTNVEINTENSFFFGSITFENPNSLRKIKHKLNFEHLSKATNSFYKKEYEKSMKICCEKDFKINYQRNDNNTLIRVGACSGAESITVNNCLNLKRTGIHAGLPKDHALTFRATDENKIFGYAELIEITQDEYKKLQKEKEEIHKSIFEKKLKDQKLLHNKMQIYYKQLENEKKAENERTEKFKQNQEKQKSLKDLENEYISITKEMNENEKDFFALKNHEKYWILGQGIAEAASKVFKKIKNKSDDFNPHEKKEYAELIKNVWIKKQEWTGCPQLSKKKKKDIKFLECLLKD